MRASRMLDADIAQPSSAQLGGVLVADRLLRMSQLVEQSHPRFRSHRVKCVSPDQHLADYSRVRVTEWGRKGIAHVTAFAVAIR